tara:strand:+ start:307 stop:564 length:258 start_codon:yes stop_codon:yes gene_type:complete
MQKAIEKLAENRNSRIFNNIAILCEFCFPKAWRQPPCVAAWGKGSVSMNRKYLSKTRKFAIHTSFANQDKKSAGGWCVLVRSLGN